MSMSDWITNCRTIEEFNQAIAMKAQMVCPISGVHHPTDKAYWETKAKTRQIHMANAIVDAYLELKGGHPELAQEILGRVIDAEA